MYNFDNLLAHNENHNLYFDFFTKPQYWPLALPNYEFLLDKLDSTGRDLFQTSWTGKEVLEQHFPVLTEDMTYGIRSRADLLARFILAKHGKKPDLQRDVFFQHRTGLSREEINLAIQVYQKKYSKKLALSRERFHKARTHLRAQLIEGTLQAVSRSYTGIGSIDPMQSENWTSYISDQHFYYGLCWKNSPRRGDDLEKPPALLESKKSGRITDLDFIFIETTTSESARPTLIKRSNSADVNAVRNRAIALLIEMHNTGLKFTKDDFVEQCYKLGIVTTMSREVYAERKKLLAAAQK